MVKLSKLGEELLIGEPSENVIEYLNSIFDDKAQGRLIDIYLDSFESKDVNLTRIDDVENNTVLKTFSDSIHSDIKLNFKNYSKEYFYKLVFFNAGSILNLNRSN